MEVESELVRLYIFVCNALEVAPHVNYVYNPHAHSPLSCMDAVHDRRRRLTRQRSRVQRHRGRTDEARRETARAANRKRLGGQNEVDVRCSHVQRLAITCGYVLKLPYCIKASREASLRGQPRMH